jgi:serine/threonine protein kinase
MSTTILKFSKSQYKQITTNYKSDNLLPVFDIPEQLKKDKEIKKCPKEEYLYAMAQSQTTQGFTRQISFCDEPDKISFVLDNGRIAPFTQFFDVIDFLGQGSFGVVLRVYDKELQKEAALKIIKKDKIDMNEVQLLKAFNHRNIVKLYSVHKNEEYFFLIMELLEGGSLKQLIQERYRNSNSDILFRETEVALIMKGIFSGLDYMHEQKIVHRDIKPENIMFANKNDLSSIKIVDLGLSNLIETSISSSAGTFIYLAPEGLNGEKYDYRVDIWACGFILYLLCSGGRHPVINNRDLYNHKEYRNEMKRIAACGGWALDGLPLLARHLFLKLCKVKPFERFDCAFCLLHPWITRKNTKIPLTNQEVIDIRKNKDHLKIVKFC